MISVGPSVHVGGLGGALLLGAALASSNSKKTTTTTTTTTSIINGGIPINNNGTYIPDPSNFFPKTNKANYVFNCRIRTNEPMTYSQMLKELQKVKIFQPSVKFFVTCYHHETRTYSSYNHHTHRSELRTHTVVIPTVTGQYSFPLRLCWDITEYYQGIKEECANQDLYDKWNVHFAVLIADDTSYVALQQVRDILIDQYRGGDKFCDIKMSLDFPSPSPQFSIKKALHNKKSSGCDECWDCLSSFMGGNSKYKNIYLIKKMSIYGNENQRSQTLTSLNQNNDPNDLKMAYLKDYFPKIVNYRYCSGVPYGGMPDPLPHVVRTYSMFQNVVSQIPIDLDLFIKNHQIQQKNYQQQQQQKQPPLQQQPLQSKPVQQKNINLKDQNIINDNENKEFGSYININEPQPQQQSQEMINQNQYQPPNLFDIDNNN